MAWCESVASTLPGRGHSFGGLTHDSVGGKAVIAMARAISALTVQGDSVALGMRAEDAGSSLSFAWLEPILVRLQEMGCWQDSTAWSFYGGR